MADNTLRVAAGRGVGSAEARRLRRQGQIPAVVYGHGMDALAVAVPGRDLRTALSTEAGLNAVITLELGDRRYLALTREIQRHPVRGTVVHVDFQVVDPDESVAAEVPVLLVGEALQVAHGDGVVDQLLFTMAVHAKPGEIPSSLEVDVTDLTIGGAIRVSEVALPAGVTADHEAETVVVMGVPPRTQTRAEAASEAAESAASGDSVEG